MSSASTLFMEKFSEAYVRAVAAVACCSVAKPDPDVEKLDLVLSRDLGVQSIAIQLKSTTADSRDDSSVWYDLDIETYDVLRKVAVGVPRYLVVVLMPGDSREWLQQTEEQLAMRRCAYYVSLAGYASTTNDSTVRVILPRKQCFTVAELDRLVSTPVGGATT